jgi:hypothetical protein
LLNELVLQQRNILFYAHSSIQPCVHAK